MRQLETLLGPRVAAAAGIELVELVALDYVAHTALGPGEIASAMRLPDHAVSRLLGRLERAGHLARSVARDDARRRTLRLTATGRAALERAHAAVATSLAPLLQELGPARLRGLTEALTLVATAEPGERPDDASGAS